jgi:hypothetical protein
MNNNWVLGYAANWSTASGWSLGHSPTTDEVAIFSATYGNGNCTIDQNVVCSGITISGSYTGNQTAAGYGYYLDSNYIDDGTGTRNLGSGMIFLGVNSTGHFGSTLGTVTATSCNLKFNDVGNTFDCDKAITFKTLNICSNSTFTSTSAATVTFTSNTTPFTVGTNSTVTFGFAAIFFKMTANGAMHNVGSGTIFSGNNVQFLAAADGLSLTFPALNFSTGNIYISDIASYNTLGNTITFTGDLNTGTSATVQVLTANTSKLTIDFNDYNIVCGTLRLRGYATAASSDQRIYMGNGTHYITTLTSVSTSSTTEKIFYEGSTVNYSGDITYWGGLQIDPGTSIVNIKDTSTITSADKPFYDLNVDTAASGTTVTFADSPRFSGDFTVTQGSTNFSNLSYSGYGDYVIEGNGQHTIGSGLTLVNPSTFTLANTLGNINSAGCYLKFNDTGYINVYSRDVTLNRLTLASGCSYVFNSTI